MQNAAERDHAVLMTAEAGMIDQSIPLVLDLDDTLLKTDTLYEQALVFLKRSPLNLFRLVAWLTKGRAALKKTLAENVDLGTAHLPLNEEVVALARTARESGRKVCIATAADNRIAQKIARRLEFPVDVIASDGTTNLKGKTKARKLEELFPQGFDYAGDSSADLPVWQAARHAILVGTSASTTRKAKSIANVKQVISRPSALKALIKAMRPHQWLKNGLIFVPALLSGQIFTPAVWPALFMTFIAMGLVASATYIINDSWDIADDRKHWSKRKRPLASGNLSIIHGVIGAIGGLLAGFTLAFAAGPSVAMFLAIYLVLTLAYSLHLKRLVFHDALVLTSLFTLRLGIGTVASDSPPSPWLFVFSMFFFLSLALAKRHTEIARVLKMGETKISGRGYRTEDLPLVLAAGMSAGMAAVVIMVLYISSDAFLLSFNGYANWLWGFPPLIFIIVSRIWSVCLRNELDDDPIVFAVEDRQCQIAVAMLGVCFFMAWFGLPLP